MAVVVSAMGGKPKVTDLLLNSVSLAATGNRAGSEVCTFSKINRPRYDFISYPKIPKHPTFSAL